MNYEKELELLQAGNGTNGRLNVSVYEGKTDLLKELSTNADDPEETYSYMEKELDYLADDKKVYAIDIGNGTPTYYNDAEEAYNYI